MASSWPVLVVEDDLTTREQLMASLAAVGGSPIGAGTVAEAIALLMEAEAPFALVVVRVELPLESGLAVVQHLKEVGRGRTPVIALCGAAPVEARLEALAAGAEDVLTRPVDGRELGARARKALAATARLAELEAEAKALHALAVTDGLTQLANHRSFQERLREEFRRAQRYDDPLGLILLDLDHFKAVNDAHGHQVGDEVLGGLAATMREAVRETDFLARYGGEEFAVVLPKTHLAGALTVAERISAGLRTARLGSKQLRVTASFGISSFPGRLVNTPEQLLKTADEALFRSKREGRNKISLYQAAAPAPT